MLETGFVITFFVIYVLLWKIKEINQKRQTGIDPRVLDKTSSNVQKYFNLYTKIMTIYGVLVIFLLTINFQWGSLFTRVLEISSLPFDIGGFVIGLAGLSLCCYAQIKMGPSWRVGIDETVRTNLVTTGVYAYIRNPTYLGLFLMNMGMWLIWPTWAMFLLNLMFIYFLEIQVRCEEDFLTAIHGKEYIEYKKHTKRYIPFLY